MWQRPLQVSLAFTPLVWGLAAGVVWVMTLTGLTARAALAQQAHQAQQTLTPRVRAEALDVRALIRDASAPARLPIERAHSLRGIELREALIHPGESRLARAYLHRKPHVSRLVHQVAGE